MAVIGAGFQAEKEHTAAIKGGNIMQVKPEAKNKNMKDNKAWKYDADYIRYVNSGESAAVYVVRDVAEQVPTKGKWSDIISFEAYEQDKDGWAFKWIVAELFPRKTNPKYDPYDIEHDRYLTWEAAHTDIDEQRKEGYKGPKYLVLCTLKDKNKGQFKTFTLKGIRKIKRYESKDGEVKDIEQKTELPEKPETIKEPLPHEWEYKITYVKKLNNEQAEYIQSHSVKLLQKINAEGKSTPEIFGFKGSTRKSKGEAKK